MPIYRWTTDGWVDKHSGERMAIPEREPQCPQVISDTPGYQSPIDGKWIEGRRARRYDLEANNCVEYEPSLSPTKGKFKNKRFCEKHGLKVSED